MSERDPVIDEVVGDFLKQSPDGPLARLMGQKPERRATRIGRLIGRAIVQLGMYVTAAGLVWHWYDGRLALIYILGIGTIISVVQTRDK